MGDLYFIRVNCVISRLYIFIGGQVDLYQCGRVLCIMWTCICTDATIICNNIV